jgi:hypothetical protein
LPDDLCLSISNLPTKWTVVPVTWDFDFQADGSVLKRGEVETLPDIDLDLLIEARERIAHVGDGLLVTGSTASLSYAGA